MAAGTVLELATAATKSSEVSRQAFKKHMKLKKEKTQLRDCEVRRNPDSHHYYLQSVNGSKSSVLSYYSPNGGFFMRGRIAGISTRREEPDEGDLFADIRRSGSTVYRSRHPGDEASQYVSMVGPVTETCLAICFVVRP